MTDVSDELLALGVQQGRSEDLAALVERHHSQLLGYLYRATGGDRQLAEELVQETFVRLLRGIGRYSVERPFKPWLYAIATNLARDQWRRSARRGAHLPLDQAGELPSADEVDRALLAGDEAQAVVAALDTLPQQQRDVVLLRFYQELSLAEIGAALRIPVGTVKSRLSLALRRLRGILIDEPADVENVYE